MNGYMSSQEFWNKFYEKAWEIRKLFVSELIAAGEKDSLRLVSLLESHERSHTIVANQKHYEQSGEVLLEFKPNKIPDEALKPNVQFSDGKFNFLNYSILPTGMPIASRGVFLHEFHPCSYYTEYNKIQFLLDYIRDKEFDAIVELGSGYSQNLIKLFYGGGPNVPYYGGEYTQSGTECAQILASQNDELDLRNFVYDFNRPSYEVIEKHKNVLVFTCHTIEQVEISSRSTLASIAGIADKVTCIHFEPFGYQLNEGRNDVDAAHAAEFDRRSWNKNLATRLLNAHKHREINLTFLGKNIMGSSDNGVNPTSLAIWSNCS